MVLSKYFVVAAQFLFWGIFMMIDAYLLIPSIILRYLARIKSQSEAGQPQQQQQRQGGLRQPRQRRANTVVVVGGSFAGLAALRKFENNPLFRVILIDPKQYFEYTPGILRLVCEPNLFRKLAYPLPHGAHEIIQGTVTTITSERQQNEVTYVDSATRQTKTLQFDYLILATGRQYQYPVSPLREEATLAARANAWKVAAQSLERAKSILILGGGAVGTELAAEIVDHYHLDQGKKVTLIDASPRLVPLFEDAKVSEYAESWLKSRGCKLLLGEMLRKWDDKSCTLRHGAVLKADLVFVCFGDKPNSGPLVANNPRALTTSSTGTTSGSGNVIQLDQRKCIQVDPFLGVPNRPNIFCCGDVAAPPTEDAKQAFHAEVQGGVAAENVMRLVTGRPFVQYPEDATSGSQRMPMVYVLSLGRFDGVIAFNQLIIPGALASLVKWILEWTKIRQMLGRPVGILIWMFGDAVTFFLSKTYLPPKPKES
ncbi:Apoptosis-inducing factor homolog B [Seminavis robusta]|uniref:Apoptosis-inducing factor homolog B n=1 Tax=Seminavis robusta TaxID=568900 RepID=A0A9N8E5X3_9STRA|nr:Apoptosis-inducing factor homolog B [Seminavis robusta]|eukprot:Sro654_g182100.1 Apoptosis-inducing factor homolog B (483) ;mRNA; r:31581-33029